MKISQVLKETEIPQVTGDLIKFNFVSSGQGEDWEGHYTDEMIGKCALGVLACESNDPTIHLSFKRRSVSYDRILETYGIKDEGIYPLLKSPTNNDDIPMWDWEEDSRLSYIIIKLNDRYNFTFKEIGEFLEVTFDL